MVTPDASVYTSCTILEVQAYLAEGFYVFKRFYELSTRLAIILLT